jgi:hypothetical protein
MTTNDCPTRSAAGQFVSVLQAANEDAAAGACARDEIRNGKGVGRCGIALYCDVLAAANVACVSISTATAKPVADLVAADHIQRACVARVVGIVGEAGAEQRLIEPIDGEKIAIDYVLDRRVIATIRHRLRRKSYGAAPLRHLGMA